MGHSATASFTNGANGRSKKERGNDCCGLLNERYRAGIETAYKLLEALLEAVPCENTANGGAQCGAQKSGELVEIMLEWAKLPPEIRIALITLVRSASRRGL